MDIFKSPWKPSTIPDPLLSLSNSQRSEKKDALMDRYCLEGLNKNLFDVEKDPKS